MTNEELEEKITKLYAWAKKTNARLDALEASGQSLPNTQSNLVNAVLWSKEEQDFLKESLDKVNPVRPKLLELENQWQNLFGHSRSYEALRKKYKRLTS